jgi:hypothetical protein
MRGEQYKAVWRVMKYRLKLICWLDSSALSILQGQARYAALGGFGFRNFERSMQSQASFRDGECPAVEK